MVMIYPSVVLEGSFKVDSGNNTFTYKSTEYNLTVDTTYNTITELLIAIDTLCGGSATWSLDYTVNGTPKVKIEDAAGVSIEWDDSALGKFMGFYDSNGDALDYTGLATSYTAPYSPQFLFMPYLGLSDYKFKTWTIPFTVSKTDDNVHRIISPGSDDISYEASIRLLLVADELEQFKRWFAYAKDGQPFTIFLYEAHGESGKYDDEPLLESSAYDWGGYLQVTLHQQSRYFNLMPKHENYYNYFTVDLKFQEYV